MASNIISNTGSLSGTIGANPVDFTSNTVTVTAVTGLTAVKTANMMYWASGELTYTVVLSNAIENDTFTDGVFTDQLDAAITLAPTADPVHLNGAPVAYTFNGNMLTITNLPPVAPGGAVTITFRVVQV